MLTILKFKTLEEAIERSNKTSYGLAAGILTKNIDSALTFARAVEAGSVRINYYDASTSQAPVSIHAIFDLIYKLINICLLKFIVWWLQTIRSWSR